jgi:hypothetical protein
MAILQVWGIGVGLLFCCSPPYGIFIGIPLIYLIIKSLTK